MSRKRNNSSWVCDRLEELMEEYEKAREDSYDESEIWTYDKVLNDLESILYSNEY